MSSIAIILLFEDVGIILKKYDAAVTFLVLVSACSCFSKYYKILISLLTLSLMQYQIFSSCQNQPYRLGKQLQHKNLYVLHKKMSYTTEE